MSRRTLAAVVVFAALVLGGGAWWAVGTSTPVETSPRTPTQSPPTGAPMRPARDAPTKRSAPPEEDDATSEADAPRLPTSGVAIGVGYGRPPSPAETRVFLVRTEDGAPIVGARLKARREGRGSDWDAGVTDAAGRVSVVVEVSERIVVAAEGYVPRWIRAAGDDDVVVLKRPTQVEGTVVDARGAPIAGASVINDRSALTLTPTSTDANGRFRLDVDPDSRDVGLVVRHDGFRTWEGGRHPGDLDIRVALSRTCAVEGLLVLPDGRAATHGTVDGADVDDDGAFRLENLTVGEHVLQAWAEEFGHTYAAEPILRLADGETVRGIRIVLCESPRSYAVLRVVGPDGASVTIGGAVAQHPGVPAIVEGGQIVVQVDCPPGREESVTLYRASAGEVEYGDLHFEVVTRAKPTGEPLVVTLPRLALFAVHVTWPGEELPPLSVRLEQTGGPSLHVAMQPATELPARFRVAVGGSYRVRVESIRYAPVVRDVTADELAAGRATVRLSDGATVRVRIVARPPTRIAAPWVVLGADGPAAWRRVPSRGLRVDGSYVIDHVRPGKCEARFLSCGSIVEKTLTIDVPEDGILDLGDVVLTGTTPLKGRVLTPDGRPAGGAEVEYLDPRRLMSTDGVNAITRVDGTFEFDVPVGATGDLRVSKDELGAVMIPLDGKASWTEVRLQPECRLRVITRATSPRGWDPSVALARPDGTGLWCPPLDGDQREGAAENVRTIRGLAPGKWVVRLHEETPPIEREVVLVAGETTEVVLDEPK